MNHFVHGVARAVVESFDLPGPILEIGSYRVAGQEDIIDLRPLFKDKPYIGIDARPGPGVDQVADVEALPFADASIGTVVALSTFEHVPHFWKGIAEVHRVLRPDGVFFIACPFYFHIHAYPSDYWRFTPEALALLLAPYPDKLIGSHGPQTRPLNVWALAFREQHPRPSAQQMARYEELMDRYAREPFPWTRRLRYLAGRLLSGSRPFTPWLQRNDWRVRRLPEHAAA